jgi:iron complex outermembrane receptor protein
MFSLGAARHDSGDTEAPDGTPLHTQFDRVSAVMQFRHRFDAWVFDAMLAPSRTDDIGKSNSRFPARDTIYRTTTTTSAAYACATRNGFQASVQGHDQHLRTVNRRPNFATTFADVESRDFGATVQQTFTTGTWSHDIGLEYLGRRNVDAFDATARSRTGATRFATAARTGGRYSPSATGTCRPGSRWSSARATPASTQDQDNADELDDSATGFTVGAVWTASDSNRFSLNLASGYRFASLEERFFSGVTAQGEVVGNPDLGSGVVARRRPRPRLVARRVAHRDAPVAQRRRRSDPADRGRARRERLREHRRREALGLGDGDRLDAGRRATAARERGARGQRGREHRRAAVR